MGCLNVEIKRIGSTPKVHLERKQGIKASCNIVCSITYDDGREVFMVKDGLFLLADGGTFKVLRNE